MPEPKTVRVRAALVLHKNGKFIIYGDDEISDDEMAEEAWDYFPQIERAGATLFFIEAAARLPDSETIEGEVKS